MSPLRSISQALEHLAHDQLDVLVVDVHALGLVDLLHLLDEVPLGRRRGRGSRAARPDTASPRRAAAPASIFCPWVTRSSRPRGNVVVVLLALGVEDVTLRAFSCSSIADRSGELGHRRDALRLARLEQLDDARETVRDVGARHTTGVERAHRELRARLADRLRGDDADRVAELDERAGRQRDAVAGAAHARSRPRTSAPSGPAASASSSPSIAPRRSGPGPRA